MILYKLTNNMRGKCFFIAVQLCSNKELKVVNFYQWNFHKQLYHILFQKNKLQFASYICKLYMVVFVI
jgi:hypothetical protein